MVVVAAAVRSTRGISDGSTWTNFRSSLTPIGTWWAFLIFGFGYVRGRRGQGAMTGVREK